MGSVDQERRIKELERAVAEIAAKLYEVCRHIDGYHGTDLADLRTLVRAEDGPPHER